MTDNTNKSTSVVLFWNLKQNTEELWAPSVTTGCVRLRRSYQMSCPLDVPTTSESPLR